MKIDVRIGGLDELLSGARLARLEDAARRRVLSQPELVERIRARQVERDAGFADARPSETVKPRISRGR